MPVIERSVATAYLWFMPDVDVIEAGRALIKARGAEALIVAERGGANVRRLGMDEKVKWWERVAAAVREIEANRS